MSLTETRVRLDVAVGDYDVICGVKDGRFPVEGTDLNFVNIEPILDAYRRMVRNVEFDVCQLTPTTYMIARAMGAPYKALPIFLSRRFHHAGLICRADAEIRSPKDLEGKKVAARSYTLTTAVWTRGVLVNEYGLDAGKVTWVVNDEEHIAEFPLPPNVERVARNRSLVQMLADGEVDAAFIARKHLADLKSADQGGVLYHDLFDDAATLEAQWYARTGVFPMHALIVVKDRVLNEHPTTVRRLYDAYVRAHDDWLAGLDLPENMESTKTYRNLRKIVGSDPLPFGLAANRRSIEALRDYALQQRLLSHPLAIEDMFVDYDNSISLNDARDDALAAAGQSQFQARQ